MRTILVLTLTALTACSSSPYQDDKVSDTSWRVTKTDFKCGQKDCTKQLKRELRKHALELCPMEEYSIVKCSPHLKSCLVQCVDPGVDAEKPYNF